MSGLEWVNLVEMTKEELATVEADERAAAWGPAALNHEMQAYLLSKLNKLAHATGCPADRPPIRWLIEQGVLIEDGSRFLFSDNADELLPPF
jgi:hypothetical protein